MNTLLTFPFFLAVLIGCSGAPREGKTPVIPPPVGGASHATPPDISVVGNGGEDLPREVEPAWFLGPRRVEYCYELSPDFGVEPAEARDLLENAFRTWRRYLADKRLAFFSSYPFRGSREDDPRLVLDAAPKDHCDGTEDLTFYLGARPDIVKAHSANYVRPLGFAQRLSYDVSRHWGKGFIAIAPPAGGPAAFPNWTQRPLLFALVLHELGHVLGCGHVRGTIMDDRIVAAMRAFHERRTPQLASALSTIDSFGRELLLCEDCRGIKMSGQLSMVAGNPRDFWGFLQVQILAGLTLSPIIPFNPGFGMGVVKLPAHLSTLDDGRGGWELKPEGEGQRGFRFTRLIPIWRTPEGQPIFKVAFLRDGASLVTELESRSDSVIYHGGLESPNHPMGRVTMRRNQGTTRLGLEFETGDDVGGLFLVDSTTPF